MLRRDTWRLLQPHLVMDHLGIEGIMQGDQLLRLQVAFHDPAHEDHCATC